MELRMIAWEGPLVYVYVQPMCYWPERQVTGQDGPHFPSQDPEHQARFGREFWDWEAPLPKRSWWTALDHAKGINSSQHIVKVTISLQLASLSPNARIAKGRELEGRMRISILGFWSQNLSWGSGKNTREYQSKICPWLMSILITCSIKLVWWTERCLCSPLALLLWSFLPWEARGAMETSSQELSKIRIITLVSWMPWTLDEGLSNRILSYTKMCCFLLPPA